MTPPGSKPSGGDGRRSFRISLPSGSHTRSGTIYPSGRPTLEKLKKCRAIIRNGVGFDSVDIEAARKLGIPVCNVPDYGTEEVADHAIALTMALCRQLFPLDHEAKKLGWTIRVQATCFGA